MERNIKQHNLQLAERAEREMERQRRLLQEQLLKPPKPFWRARPYQRRAFKYSNLPA
jgi:hypothetical protein